MKKSSSLATSSSLKIKCLNTVKTYLIKYLIMTDVNKQINPF